MKSIRYAIYLHNQLHFVLFQNGFAKLLWRGEHVLHHQRTYADGTLIQVHTRIGLHVRNRNLINCHAIAYPQQLCNAQVLGGQVVGVEVGAVLGRAQGQHNFHGRDHKQLFVRTNRNQDSSVGVPESRARPSWQYRSGGKTATDKARPRSSAQCWPPAPSYLTVTHASNEWTSIPSFSMTQLT